MATLSLGQSASLQFGTTIASSWVKRDGSYSITLSGSTLKLTVTQGIANDGSELSGYNINIDCNYNGVTQTLTLSGTKNNDSQSVSFTWDKSVTSLTMKGKINFWKLYFNSTSYDTLEATWSNPNTAPTAKITVPELIAGQTARISWTTSDADGDTVKATKLIRYYKASGTSGYTTTTLYNNSSGMTTKYYDDIIPDDAADGSIYYQLTISDGKKTATITSATVTVIAGSSFCGNQNFGGAWEEMDSVWECYNGVWTEIAEGYECINGVWQETN